MVAIFRAMGMFFKFLFKYKSVIPRTSIGIFIIIMFFYNLVTEGVVVAFSNLSRSVFGAELTINQNVHLAISNSPNYGSFQFFEIIIALMTLYILVKYITKVLVKFTASQSEWGAGIFAVLVVAIISISYTKIVDGSFGFLPIIDSVFFLFTNIQPVIINAIPTFWGLFDKSIDPIVNSSDPVTNVTNITNSSL